MVALLTMMFLSGCGTTGSECPPVIEYSPEYQAAAADELETMKPSCQMNAPREDCSVVRALVSDYLQLRDRLRECQP